MLGLANFKNLHIVVASDEGLAKCIVVLEQKRKNYELRFMP
jgi:hypothetical protein